MSQRYTKEERLKSLSDIGALFEKGDHVFAYPIRTMFLTMDEKTDFPEVGFSVPKRSFKRAHDRNLIKRRMREAYRLNAGPFKVWFKTKEFSIKLMFIYIDKEILDYSKIEHSMVKCLQKLMPDKTLP